MRFENLKGKFFVVAHRGASGYEPENTIRAIRRAIEMGVDAVEVDVRLTKDGYPILMHDETVDRTTNGTGKVSEMTLTELRKLDAGKGEKVPLLEEALNEVKDKAVLFIEIKVPEASIPSLKLVEEKNMIDQVLFVSFNPNSLKKIKEENPFAHTGLIYAKPGDHILLAKRIECEVVLPHYRLATEKAIALAHKLKMLVVAWTIDDIKTAKLLKKRGVDGIGSNYPDIMLSLRNEDN